MKKLLFTILIISLNFYAQTHLNKNWVLFNKDNSPLLSNSINALFEDDDNGYWISSVGENNRGYLQFFNDDLWQTFDSINSPLNTSVIITDITQTADGKMLFGTVTNGLYIKDNGDWDSINTSNSPLPDNFIYRVTVDKLNRYWLGIPNYCVAVYDNGNWTFYNNQNSFNGIEDLNFIKVDSLGYIWIGTDYYGLYYYDSASWIKSISGQFSGGPAQVIVGLSIDSENRKWITINERGGGTKIAKSVTDTSFIYYDSTNIGFSFSLLSYDGVVIDQNNTKYFGTTNGLLKYDDMSWQIFDTSNSPIPSNWFNKGIIDSKNNIVYVLSSFYPPAQNYGLIFYNQDSVIVTSIENSTHFVNTYYISQNYPNPFNPVTKIKFSIPKSDIVKIGVYDVLGKEIQTLLNAYKTTASYEVDFDASSLPSGVYFYRMISGSYVETKKMILLR
ncbi:MAG: T9SS type A sorting domain-containing protein [Ignavibacterium sp.]|uniref:T9SS type A sorting domain-containing protein n=1 Tax=Ignavibacterium sp. TaxID=2651167 RepID=UPI0032978934